MSIVLRLRSSDGTFTLKLADNATVTSLKEEVFAQTKVPINSQDLRFGFPPKPINDASPEALLKDVGIKSGESINLSVKSSESSSLGSNQTPKFDPSAPPPNIQSNPTASSLSSSHPIPKPKKGSKNISSSVSVEGGYLVLRVVPDDNSCLFSALGIVLENGDTGAPRRLRQVVVDTIKSDPFTYSEVVLGQSPESYMKAISSPQTWGGAIELSIISKHYRVRIATLDVVTGSILIFGEDEESFQDVCILVYSGIHYDAVTLSPVLPSSTGSPTYPPTGLDFDTTRFSLEDFEVFYQPRLQNMLQDLRSQRYWTDTSSFSLRCERCGAGLVGEKEAREHAAKTGHTDFGEYE